MSSSWQQKLGSLVLGARGNCNSSSNVRCFGHRTIFEPVVRAGPSVTAHLRFDAGLNVDVIGFWHFIPGGGHVVAQMPATSFHTGVHFSDFLRQLRLRSMVSPFPQQWIPTHAFT